MRNQASPFSNTSRRILFSFWLRRGIALEAVARLRRIVDDRADHLARLRLASQRIAEAVGVAHRLLALDVEAHHRDRKAVRDEPRHAADRARLALEIEHGHVAFGRAVEFQDVRDAEARLELLPHVGAQAVAAGEPQVVPGLVGVAAANARDSGTARRCTGTACIRSRTTSSQNSRAENFSRITTEPPLSSTEPVATSPPVV